MQDRTKYYAVIPDELNAAIGGPASFIPTFGAPTSVIDLYRTVGVAETNLPDVKAAFTDEQAIAALSKIAAGGISTVADLEAAEIALEALLLHDMVHVITHAPKIDYGNGLIGYKRLDEAQRTDLGFEIMRLANSRDWIFAPEIVRVEGDTVVQTGLKDSPSRGMKVNAVGRGQIVETPPGPLRTERWTEALPSPLGGTGSASLHLRLGNRRKWVAKGHVAKFRR
jgi:hypothetical protein